MFFPVHLLVPFALVALAQPQTAPDNRGPINRHLPPWLTLGTELRLRLERPTGIAFTAGENDTYLLTRTRLQIGIEPKSWIRFFAEGQDSRVSDQTKLPGRPNFHNPFDLRQAYASLGGKDGPFELRVGRQELTFGAERLVGINHWNNFPRTFDAVKAQFRHGQRSMDIFSASVVAVDPDGADLRRDGEFLHGINALWPVRSLRLSMEPFLLYRSRRNSFQRGVAGSDAYTGGFYLNAKPRESLQYIMEVAWQRGRVGAESLQAFYGLWKVTATPFNNKSLPGFVAEHSYASGDSRPGDGKRETFEHLYPRLHPIWGIADQLAGRNLHNLRLGAEWPFSKKTTFLADYHFFWLASRNDGIYAGNGRVLVPAVPGGAANSDIGREIDLQIIHKFNQQWLLGIGFARIFPGSFLNRQTTGSAFTYPHIFLQFNL